MPRLDNPVLMHCACLIMAEPVWKWVVAAAGMQGPGAHLLLLCACPAVALCVGDQRMMLCKVEGVLQTMVPWARKKVRKTGLPIGEPDVDRGEEGSLEGTAGVGMGSADTAGVGIAVVGNVGLVDRAEEGSLIGAGAVKVTPVDLPLILHLHLIK